MTDGVITEGLELDPLLAMLRNLNTATINAKIFTYALGSDAAPTAPKAIACAHQGVFTAIPDRGDLRTKMAQYYQYLAAGAVRQQAVWAEPYIDCCGMGNVTSISLPCYSGENPPQLIGVIGSSVPFSFLGNVSLQDLLLSATTCQPLTLTEANIETIRGSQRCTPDPVAIGLGVGLGLGLPVIIIASCVLFFGVRGWLRGRRNRRDVVPHAGRAVAAPPNPAMAAPVKSDSSSSSSSSSESYPDGQPPPKPAWSGQAKQNSPTSKIEKKKGKKKSLKKPKKQESDSSSSLSSSDDSSESSEDESNRRPRSNPKPDKRKSNGESSSDESSTSESEKPPKKKKRKPQKKDKKVTASSSSSEDSSSSSSAPKVKGKPKSPANIPTPAGKPDLRHSAANECRICMDRKIKTVFVPCGHRVACKECAAKVGPNHDCPICRTAITQVIETFDT